MTKKGGSAKKGQALSLHDFITNTPGALPLSACLPSRHGEVSKIESLTPKFGELSFGRDHPPPYDAPYGHHHPPSYAPRYSSPYSNPYYDSHPFAYGGGSPYDVGAPSRADLHGYGYTYVPPPPPPPPRRPPPPPSHENSGRSGSAAFNNVNGTGFGSSTLGSPIAPHFSNGVHHAEGGSSGVRTQGFEVGSPGGSFAPGAVKLLRRQEGERAAGEVAQQQQQQYRAFVEQQQHQQQEREEKQLQQRAKEVEQELLASHEERAAAAEAAETAALAAAASAKADAAAATAAVTEVPLLVPLPQQAAQQAARQEAAAVKNEYAERMAAQALARMAARSALHSSSLTASNAASPRAATPTTSTTTSSANGVVGGHAPEAQPMGSASGGTAGVEPLLPGGKANGEQEEALHSVRLQRALEERQQQQQQQQQLPPPPPHPPAQRPRLNLLPRSKPLDVEEPPPASSSSIFGGARPRDERLHPTTGSGSVGSGPTTATSLANVQLHSLSASYCGRSRGGSVASFDGGSSKGGGQADAWQTVGSRGKSRADSLSTANCDDLDPFFSAPIPPPRSLAFGGGGSYGENSNFLLEDDGNGLWGKRGLPLRNNTLF